MAFSLGLTQAVYIYFLVRDKVSRKRYELVPAGQIAETLGIPKPSVVKLLGAMAQAGVLATGTGIKGGVKLAPGAEEHTLLDLFTAVEGRKPIFRTDFEVKAEGERPLLAQKVVEGLFQDVERDFLTSLGAIRLADLMPGSLPL